VENDRVFPGLASQSTDQTNMQTQLTDIIEELQRNAKVCETVAQDKTQEALTAESCDTEKNMQEAKEWTIKSKVWLEAEAVVRGFLPPPLNACEAAPPVCETVPAPLRPATGAAPEPAVPAGVLRPLVNSQLRQQQDGASEPWF